MTGREALGGRARRDPEEEGDEDVLEIAFYRIYEFIIYLFIFAAHPEPKELWQGSDMEGPEPSYASHRT